jgi:hypothetical protein
MNVEFFNVHAGFLFIPMHGAASICVYQSQPESARFVKGCGKRPACFFGGLSVTIHYVQRVTCGVEVFFVLCHLLSAE